MAHFALRSAAEDLKVNLRILSGSTPARQAKHIEDCVAEGAKVIGTTLAAPDVVGPQLKTTRAAGVQVFSFNSGADAAVAAGAALHIGIDDPAIGTLAGQTFKKAGISGAVLCVVHEERNIGLEERCDRAEAAFGGAVERLRVHGHGLANPAGVQARISERIERGGVGGVFTLNGDLVDAARAAIATSGQDIELGTVGLAIDFIRWTMAGEMLFAISDQPQIHAYLALNAAQMVGVFSASGADASQVFRGTQVLIKPLLIDRAAAETFYSNLTSQMESVNRE